MLEGTTAWGIATRTSNMDMVTTEMNSERTTIAVKSVKTEKNRIDSTFCGLLAWHSKPQNHPKSVCTLTRSLAQRYKSMS